MTETEELKPCPVCGDKYPRAYKKPDGGEVECRMPECWAHCDKDSVEHAIAAWNRRAPADSDDDARRAMR